MGLAEVFCCLKNGYRDTEKEDDRSVYNSTSSDVDEVSES